MHYVILEKSEGRWVQGRLFQEKPLRKVKAGDEDPKLGTTNLGEKLTDAPMSIEELDAHLNRIQEEWDRGRGLEKARTHKYIKRTGTSGNYQYWYPTPEATATMSATAHAKQLGSQLSYGQAKKLWEEWHEIQVTEPPTHDRDAWGKRVMRSQLLRETVEGFLGSMEDAMTPQAIDEKLYPGGYTGKTFKMEGDKVVSKHGASRLIQTTKGHRFQIRGHGKWETQYNEDENPVKRWNEWAPEHKRVPETSKKREKSREHLTHLPDKLLQTLSGNADPDTAGFQEDVRAEIERRKGKTFGMEGVEEGSEKKIKDLMKKYHLKEIILLKEESSQKALGYLHSLLDHISGKMEIDGGGMLKIKVGEIDEKGTSAFYHSNNTEIELDKKYTDTFSHEYGHFVFDRKISPSTRTAYLKAFPDDDHITEERKQDWNSLKDDVSVKNLDAIFQPFFDNVGGGTKTPQEKASLDLLHKLVDYHKKNIGNLAKSNHFRFDYLLDPSEMIARAVSYYTDKDIIPVAIHMENNFSWKKLVTAWGDKYLKTGIFKSFIIWEV